MAKQFRESDPDDWLAEYAARVNQRDKPGAARYHQFTPMAVFYGANEVIHVPCHGEADINAVSPDTFDETLFARYVGIQRDGDVMKKFFGGERSFTQGKIFEGETFIFVFRLLDDNRQWVEHNGGFWIGPLRPDNVQFVAVLYNPSDFLNDEAGEQLFDVHVQNVYDALNAGKPVARRVPMIPYYVNDDEQIVPLFSWC